MQWRKFCKIAILCCLVVWLIAVMVQPAFAQKGAAMGKGGGDKSIAEKKGIEGLFQSNKFSKDNPNAPTRLQKYLGIGSFGVMIIVVKYL